jgi:hypothetical protein
MDANTDKIKLTTKNTRAMIKYLSHGGNPAAGSSETLVPIYQTARRQSRIS